MSYLGTGPGNQVATAQQIADGVVTPAKLTTGAPTWDGSGNLNLTGSLRLDSSSADGPQLTLASSGYSDWNWDNYNGRLRAYYGATEYFTINTSGNVGIGTNSPARRLSVLGSTNDNVPMRVTSGPSTVDCFIDFKDPNTTADYKVRVGCAADALLFYAGGAERARIDSSGNLLVGTTSAISQVTIAIANGGNAISTRNASGTSAYNAALFYNNGSSSLVGYINVSGSSTLYSTSSDYRLKENIAPMTGALSVVQQLKPCTYTWKADGSDGQGFIAHELQDVIPDAVVGTKDAVDEDGNPKYQGIDTSFLVATLTAAIQEQQAMIEQLKADVAALKETKGN